MNTSLSPQVSWAALAALNFLIQIACFYNDRSRALFVAKKVTTPLLLFTGCAIVLVRFGGFPLMPGVILLAMGLGELGIEGSSVVEARDSSSAAPEGQPSAGGGFDALIVTVAGAVFLLVNISIGSVLLYRSGEPFLVARNLGVGTLFFAVALVLLFRMAGSAKEDRFQITLYSVSLVVLFAGVLTDWSAGGTTGASGLRAVFSPLGIAASILTLSDFLVLVRMGARFDKARPSGFAVLLAFLVVILLLYYGYMAVMIWLV